MRILHTSDWHLGRSFLGERMLPHQSAYLDHLLGVVEEREVDLVLVAGDVYDRALPPTDAVALLQTTLERLADSRATAVLTSGNHDSHLRLGFAARLIDRAGVHLRTHPADVGVPVELIDEHGPVVVHALPYLDPDHLHRAWDLPDRSHEAVLGEALRRVRTDLAGRPPGTRSILMAHAFVAGVAPSAQGSDSERDISVGGVQVVPLGLFDDLDYVALGHLHRPQTLTDRVRYSGSPLAYSFSESGQTKGSWLVELGADGFAGAELITAPVPRPLARLRGCIDDLLTDPSLEIHAGSWVQAVLTDLSRPRQAKPRLEQRFPHVLSIAFEPEGATPLATAVARTGPGISDHQVTLDFVTEVRGRPADAAEAGLLREAVEAASRDPEADNAPGLFAGAAGAAG